MFGTTRWVQAFHLLIPAVGAIAIGSRSTAADIPAIVANRSAIVVTGTIRNAANGSPVRDAQVSLATTPSVAATSKADGRYLLNLQLPRWVTDAAPSRPLLFFVDDG